MNIKLVGYLVEVITDLKLSQEHILKIKNELWDSGQYMSDQGAFFLLGESLSNLDNTINSLEKAIKAVTVEV